MPYANGSGGEEFETTTDEGLVQQFKSATSPEVYALFESLNGEMLRQKIYFEAELKRQRETTGSRITKLEMELEQREADCKSLQNSVTILGRSLDAMTEALERLAPSLTTAPGGHQPRSARGKSPAQGRSSSLTRQATPKGRAPSPRKRADSRPASPEPKRSRTPTRDSDARTPYGQDYNTALRGRGAGPVKSGAVPHIGGARKTGNTRNNAPSTPTSIDHKGATAVRDLPNAEYLAGARYPSFLQSPIYTPEGMDGLDKRPSQLPNAKLELSNIYGCSVDGYNDSVVYGDEGRKVVCYAAAVGVTVDCTNKKQNFSFHHTSEICSIAAHPNHKYIATAQKGSRATSVVVVWDVNTLANKATLKDAHESGVAAMAFSACGTYLATVGGDAHHTFVLYKWETKEIVAQARLSGDAVYNVYFDPFSPSLRGVVVGKRSVKFVELVPTETRYQLKVRQGVLSPHFSLNNQRVVCAAYVDADTVLTGTDNGNILVWTNEQMSHVMHDAHAGGVSSIKTIVPQGGERARYVATAGRDGTLRLWNSDNVEDFSTLAASKVYEISSILKKKEMLSSAEQSFDEALRLIATGKAPVRSMDLRYITEDVVRVACLLFSNQIVEFDVRGEDLGSLFILLQGHSALPMGSLQSSEQAEDVAFVNVVGGVASHPTYPIAATVGSDCTLRFWNTFSQQLSLVVQMPQRGLCVDFSPDGRFLAVGFEAGTTPSGKHFVGGGCVYAVIGTNSGDIVSCKHVCKLEESRGASGYCVKFDPKGRHIALGGALNRIDIYDARNDFRRVAQTKGHNSEVLRLDWSVDGEHLQSDDRTPEHLYFTKEGQRVIRPHDIKALNFGRWTCAYGWEVQGLWDARMTASSVSSVDHIAEGDLCVVGDVSASINLYSYPMPMHQASHKKYRGHGDEITGVAFNGTCTSLYSSSTDGCLFQWAVVTAQ
eukprot:TRINITY_DN16225_c0_g1_i1.p1 TRINITY_DN16225_c0_g1~~TRINITY_DN16225_c0_g1_i1.p1  ORF type:complete len:956 (+),score=386.73 TRINITY_DN16225_c0_g1_i1:47-2869(+)